MKTQKEINKQIRWLIDNKTKIPESSIFGDDNWACIDAIIEVLEKKMSLEEVYEKNDSQEWTDNQTSGASDASDWLNGEDVVSPIKDWEILAGK